MRYPSNKLLSGKIVLVFVTLIIAISIMPRVSYANPSLEDSGDAMSLWAVDLIIKAEKADLVPKRLQGKYKDEITREEYCKLTVKLYEFLSNEKNVTPGENPFTDTESSEVLAAYKLEIIQGKGGGAFEPNNSVTREEASVMLYRALQAADQKNSYKNVVGVKKTKGYDPADRDEISPWAREAIECLYEMEIISGTDGNRFNPGESTTREEAIVLIMRAYDRAQTSEKETRDIPAVSRGGVQRQESDFVIKLQESIDQEIGKPYMWGGTGPDGYDCSGFVYAMFQKLGISLPRTSKGQADAGEYVAKKDLAYGDIVLFARDGESINHAGIYTGEDEFVHSPQSGDVVKVSSLTSGYYADCYYTARRVLP